MVDQASGQENQETADSWSSGGAAPQEEAPANQSAVWALAIASVACGLLGFLWTPAAILGLILGNVALVKIGRGKGKMDRRALAIAGTAFSGVSLLLACGSLVAALLAVGRTRAERARCSANVHSLAVAIGMYEIDYDYELPEGLEDLRAYRPVPAIFVCPTDPEPMVIAGGLRCSYHYVGRLSPNPDEGVILIYENAGNHPEARHVLLANLRVKLLLEDEFRRRLKESLELVKEAGWEEYSEERRAEIEAFYAGEPP